MSTQVNIDVNGFVALKQQTDEVARANKESAVQRDENKAVSDQVQQSQPGYAGDRGAPPTSTTGWQPADPPSSTERANTPTAAGAGSSTPSERRGDIPSSSLVRELSAQLNNPLVVPFAISWRGVFTGIAERTVLTKIAEFEIFGTGRNGYSLITSTFRGGRDLSPSPIRFAAANAAVFSSEISRMERWSTSVVTCEASSSPTECKESSYSDESFHGNYWLTSAKRSSSVNEPYVPVEGAPQPAVTLPVGDTSYKPSVAIVTVAEDKTVFLTFDLPKQPKALTAYTFPEFEAAGYPEDSLVSNSRIDMPYSYAYEAYQGLATSIYSPQTTQRYIFIQYSGSNMQSKIVDREPSENFNDFLFNNLYTNDPSRDVRKAGYLGEYRLKGRTASFLRFRDKDGNYAGFPYSYLESYKGSVGAPVFSNGEGFEDFTYKLNSWFTIEELKSQLTALADSNDLDPAPSTRVKIPGPTGLFLRAKEKLGTDEGEELTPTLYLAIGQ